MFYFLIIFANQDIHFHEWSYIALLDFQLSVASSDPNDVSGFVDPRMQLGLQANK